MIVPVVDTLVVVSNRVVVATLALGLMTVSVAGCASLPSGHVTVTNRTGTAIRITGGCTPDDAAFLRPGESDSDVYLGSQCRIDNGDGSKGMLGCVILKVPHADITPADLRHRPGPNDCWGTGAQ